VKRLLLQLGISALAVAVAVVLAWGVRVYANHGSVSFRCGMLATANEQYLDDSNALFQRCSWHLGKGTRTWGETYGIKVWRVYVSLGVQHIDPSITPSEAEE
jgi:hypothetical protein